jgi:glycosyltransferase involved in cell wall biosynthesis
MTVLGAVVDAARNRMRRSPPVAVSTPPRPEQPAHPGRRPELISVIVPVRDCAAFIGDQMAALAAQTYTGAWEVVVVDNGSSDRSAEVAEGWRERLPSLTVVDASARRGLNYARNAGVAAARGDFLAFCDADDAAVPGWLEALADGATRADIVGGEIELEELNDALGQAWERAEPLRSLPTGNFVPYPPGGNCGIWTSVAREIGWDEAFAFGSSDMEFGWRAQLAGFRVEFVPDAVMRLRYRRSLRALVHQHFRYGVSEPHLFRSFRDRGMPRSDLREAADTWRWLAANVRRLHGDEATRGHWLRVAAMRLGRLCGSVRRRVLYP